MLKGGHQEPKVMPRAVGSERLLERGLDQAERRATGVLNAASLSFVSLRQMLSGPAPLCSGQQGWRQQELLLWADSLS